MAGPLPSAPTCILWSQWYTGQDKMQKVLDCLLSTTGSSGQEESALNSFLLRCLHSSCLYCTVWPGFPQFMRENKMRHTKSKGSSPRMSSPWQQQAGICGYYGSEPGAWVSSQFLPFPCHHNAICYCRENLALVSLLLLI